VEAFDLAYNVSAPSPITQVTTWNNIPPSVPTKVVATAVSCQQINLTWAASTGKVAITGYLLFSGTSASNLTRTGATGGGTSYTYYPLTPGTKYYFGVEAVDADGNVSTMSAIVSATTLAPPSPPANVMGAAISSAEIKVTWTAAQSGMPLAYYRVSRGSSPSNLTSLIILSPTTTSFTNYPVTSGATYYYGIQSANTGGNVSPMSAVVKVTTPN